ncbi:MAG: hypothetical protein WDM92_10270 [Caulobacteraceae bacterium]
MTAAQPLPTQPAVTDDSLGVQPWMAAPATRAVIEALEAAGGPAAPASSAAACATR